MIEIDHTIVATLIDLVCPWLFWCDFLSINILCLFSSVFNVVFMFCNELLLSLDWFILSSRSGYCLGIFADNYLFIFICYTIYYLRVSILSKVHWSYSSIWYFSFFMMYFDFSGQFWWAIGSLEWVVGSRCWTVGCL